MINRQMKTVELWQLVQGYDKYNRPTKVDWEKVDTIDVAINFKEMSHKSEDIRYKESTHNGLTDYKVFDLKASYKLVADNVEYEIKVINQITRKTQLYLKELIPYE